MIIISKLNLQALIAAPVTTLVKRIQTKTLCFFFFFSQNVPLNREYNLCALPWNL